MIERVLQGPFLTRAQAARRSRTPGPLLVHRPDLLRVDGRWLQEAYFAFQFDRNGVRPALARVVQDLKATHADVAIADWLVRPHPSLDYSAPLKYLKSGGKVERVLAAASARGPVADAPVVEKMRASDTGPEEAHLLTESSADRRARRRRSTHRPAFGSR